MRLIFVSCLCVCLAGCQFAGTIYTGVHKVGSVLLDDRSFSDDWNDTKMNLAIRDALTRQNGQYAIDIEVTVFEGQVLLNGALPNLELIDQVVQTVWSVSGVQRIYNYIRINNPPSLEIVNQDAVLSAKIRMELSLTAGISSVNYKLVMENGTVYMIGIAQSREELEKTIAVVKNTPGVTQVISLMRYKKDGKKVF